MKYSKKCAHHLNVQSKNYNVVPEQLVNVYFKNVRNRPIPSHLGLDLVHGDIVLVGMIYITTMVGIS